MLNVVVVVFCGTCDLDRALPDLDAVDLDLVEERGVFPREVPLLLM